MIEFKPFNFSSTWVLLVNLNKYFIFGTSLKICLRCHTQWSKHHLNLDSPAETSVVYYHIKYTVCCENNEYLTNFVSVSEFRIGGRSFFICFNTKLGKLTKLLIESLICDQVQSAYFQVHFPNFFQTKSDTPKSADDISTFSN